MSFFEAVLEPCRRTWIGIMICKPDVTDSEQQVSLRDARCCCGFTSGCNLKRILTFASVFNCCVLERKISSGLAHRTYMLAN